MPFGTGGYGNVFYLHQRQGLNTTACHLARAQTRSGSPIPATRRSSPHLHSRLRRLSVEVNAHVGIAAQRRPHLGAENPGDKRSADQIPELSATTTWERIYPAFGNPFATSHRAPPSACDEGRGVGEPASASIWISAMQSSAWAPTRSASATANSVRNVMTASPARIRTRCRCGSIRRALHNGGSVVDYQLMSTIPGCSCSARRTSSDHGANRLRPALM